MGLTNFKIKSAAIGKRHHDGRGLYLTYLPEDGVNGQRAI